MLCGLFKLYSERKGPILLTTE